ncbi:MAG: CapA family protein [Cyanobacteriota bacterium]|nr:CapA family protein [Cyanobacteriota bacterium]
MGNRSLQRVFSLGVITFCVGSGIAYVNRLQSANLEPASIETPESVASSTTPPLPATPEPVTPAAIPATPTTPEPAATATLTPQIELEPEPQTAQQFPESIVIKAVGDIVPATNFPDNRLPADPNQVLPTEVRGYLERADIVFGNFESSLTNHPYSTKNVGSGRVFAFRTPPEYAKIFGDAGFDVMNIANNHAMDFGAVGLQDTVENLGQFGIETVGHKNQILYEELQGLKVAFLGFSPYDYYNSVNDINTAKSLIEEATKNAEIVVVSMHAGAEGTQAMHVGDRQELFFGENRGNPVKFARMAIDSGADLILGHSPHVPRAIELYNGKLIAYSLGNFMGYRTLSTAAQSGYSMILEVQMNPSGDFTGGRVIPVHMDSQGIPYIDQYFRTIGLLRHLTEKDFPDTPITLNNRGEIVFKDGTSE